jgi:hypothetical protein
MGRVARSIAGPPASPLCPCRWSRSGASGPLRCRCFVPWLTTRCRPGAQASLKTPSPRGRSGLLSLSRGGLRLSAVACLPVALVDLCGCVWGLSRVSVSCVACVCLCLASALCLSAPMLLGVSLVPLSNTM